jgi:hypothetical protein
LRAVGSLNSFISPCALCSLIIAKTTSDSLICMAIERMVEEQGNIRPDEMMRLAGCVLNGISPTLDEFLRKYFIGMANAALKECEMIESMDIEPLERIDSLI